MFQSFKLYLNILWYFINVIQFKLWHGLKLKFANIYYLSKILKMLHLAWSVILSQHIIFLFFRVYYPCVLVQLWVEFIIPRPVKLSGMRNVGMNLDSSVILYRNRTLVPSQIRSVLHNTINSAKLFLIQRYVLYETYVYYCCQFGRFAVAHIVTINIHHQTPFQILFCVSLISFRIC